MENPRNIVLLPPEARDQNNRVSANEKLARDVSSSYSPPPPPPPIDMLTEMQHKKKNTFLAFLRLLYALEWTK